MFHLLPCVEQDNDFKMAVWLDRGANVGQAKPNPSKTINIGFIWPTWDSVNKGNNTWLRQTLVKTYRCPSDPSLGNCLDWCDGQFVREPHRRVTVAGIACFAVANRD